MNLDLLRFEFNTIVDIEEKADKGFGTLWQDLIKTDFRVIRLLIWGGLKWQDKDLTLESVGEQIQAYMAEGGNIIKVAEKLTKVIERSGVIGVFTEAEG